MVEPGNVRGHCFGRLYRDGDSRIIRFAPVLLRLFGAITSHPYQFPVVFWIMLVLEERSLEIFRRVFKWIDMTWHNQNWHLAHHTQPTAPWVDLPDLGRQQEAHPDFLLWHHLRMWRGPRYTDERGQGHYAGKVTES